MTIDINGLTLRQLPTESARVLSCNQGFDNHDLVQFNKLAHPDSHAWYRAVIVWYVDQYGDLPSRAGPGIHVKLLIND